MFATIKYGKEGIRNKPGNSADFAFSRSFIQPKLNVNSPNDKYEQEADAVADRVMRVPSTSWKPTFFQPSTLSIQRECEHCKAEEQKFQGKETNAGGVTATAPESYISSVSRGRFLSENERTFFESRMGYDFSNVRLHSDNKANDSAKSINALAYTHGNDIVFANNQYQPETNEGKRLLAHELTHVVQQNQGLQTKFIQRQEGKDPATLSNEELNDEYKSIKEYVNNLGPTNESEEQDSYFQQYRALEAEVRKRCLKEAPVQPTDVSQKLIDRITNKYATIDGDPGEGMIPTPYYAGEGQCTIGYGHVIFPKSLCTIITEAPAVEAEAPVEEPKKGKPKKKAQPTKKCICQPPYDLISKERAITHLKSDIKNQVNEVRSKIKVNLNQAEFDAMADLALHVGSLPADFVSFVHANWCTDKEAVHERYLKTALYMKEPDTGKMILMKNFVERRKKRSW